MRYLAALIALLFGLLYVAHTTTLRDWQACGIAGTDHRNTCRQMEK